MTIGKSSFWRTVRRCVYVYCGVQAVGSHIGELLYCTGVSMHPTILDGDLIIAERLSVKLGNVHRGDIVGVLSPTDANLICKRITHKQLDRIYDCELLPKGRVPRGHSFVQGDNTMSSTDSRTFGPVPDGLVEVRLILRIWPLNRFGWMSNHWFWEKEEEPHSR
uniref:Peptidase_S24 domain-containing protein n=1 Tax=Steinernema glaseri TaxID=37863 RepID=A0A1I7ZD98_9BILA